MGSSTGSRSARMRLRFSLAPRSPRGWTGARVGAGGPNGALPASAEPTAVRARRHHPGPCWGAARPASRESRAGKVLRDLAACRTAALAGILTVAWTAVTRDLRTTPAATGTGTARSVRPLIRRGATAGPGRRPLPLLHQGDLTSVQRQDARRVAARGEPPRAGHLLQDDQRPLRNRLSHLHEATLRRTPPSPRLSRPLHAPGRAVEPPPPRADPDLVILRTRGQQSVTLPPLELLRRFLFQVLPYRFRPDPSSRPARLQ